MFARRGSGKAPRIPAYLGLSCLVVAVVVLGASFATGDVTLPPGLSFSTSGPVSASQCAPCHGNPGDFQSDKLIFKHAAHITLACGACHQEFPHSQTGLKKPAMDFCFTCHGMNHGEQGTIAERKCETCHPSTAPKVPADHTDEWKTSGHKSASQEQLRTCEMCHKPSECEDCHAANGVKKRDVATYIFESVVPAMPNAGSAFSVTAIVSMSQCAYCHPNIDGFNNSNLIFKHDVHLARSISCDRCHTSFPHNTTAKGTTRKPPMQLCYGCHSVLHNGAKVASDDCYACHPRSTNLVPANHTDEFKTSTHPNDAKKNLGQCEMCHQATFCANCHTAKGVVAKSHGMGKYSNGEVRAKWRKVHGQEATDKEDCWVCHTQRYCDDCHQTEIPHAVTWLGTHGKLSMGKEKECDKCHQGETSCQDCHHGQVKTSRLTKQNCITCHPLYKNDFRTIFSEAEQAKAAAKANGGQFSGDDARYYRGYSVHAAHFEMTNTQPFSCERCHGETIKQGAQYYSFKILCARCHGAYANGKLIAKFEIPELCFRCHADMSGLIGP
ncbi:MAG: hypothetical protein M1335_06430 [Chloroflexi bacterium]|nr:hypothetical protein [Chloroflexota bacterium]